MAVIFMPVVRSTFQHNKCLEICGETGKIGIILKVYMEESMMQPKANNPKDTKTDGTNSTDEIISSVSNKDLSYIREHIELLRESTHKILDDYIDDLLLHLEDRLNNKKDIVCRHPLNWPFHTFKGTQVLSVELPNGQEVSVKTWKSAVKAILEDCNSNPEYHEQLLYLCGKVNGNFRHILFNSPNDMRSPIRVDKGIYFEAKLDTEQLLRVLVEKVLAPVGYNCDKVQINHTLHK